MNHVKRGKKIEQLVLFAGFSATGLSRASNKVLEQTYQSAIPLIREKQEEIARVMARENKHTRKKREELSKKQQTAQATINWSINWRPPPKIVANIKPGSEAGILMKLADESEIARKRAADKFRETGNHEFADAANKAREARDSYEDSAKLALQK